MVTRSAVKPKVPVPSTTQGNTLLGNIQFAFDASVVAFSITCIVAGAIYVLITDVDLEKNSFTSHGFKYMHLFFSLWGSAVQSLYFYLLFALDIIKIYSRNSTRLYKIGNKLKTFGSYLFFTAVFPMSVAICALFWGLYFIDRELIYPRILDQIYPTWINHAMHSVPLALVFIYVLIEMEPPMKHTLTGIIGILTFYGACVLYVKKRDNKWMYIGLHYLNEDRAVHLLTIGAVGCIFTTILGHELSRAAQHVRMRLMKINK